jgi:hypothetical protein
MNPASAFLLFQPVLLVICAVVLIVLAYPIKRERELRGRLLLERYPEAPRHSIILPLRTSFRGGKQREIDACIEQMRQRGLVLLDLGAVSPFISLRHWGGAVRLDFLEVKEVAESDLG